METAVPTDGQRGLAAPVPRWAIWAAYAVPLCVLPSALWRASLVTGGELAIAEGGWYPLSLSAVSMGLALLTLGLVHGWGEVVPRWLPLLGGRRIPIRAAVVPATFGAIAVTGICIYAVLNLNFHFVEQGPVLIETNAQGLQPPEGWAVATYAPILAWGPLLAAVTMAYHRRRTQPATSAVRASTAGPM